MPATFVKSRFRLPEPAAKFILAGLTKVHNTVPEITNPVTKKPCSCGQRYADAAEYLNRFINDNVLPGEEPAANSEEGSNG